MVDVRAFSGGRGYAAGFQAGDGAGRHAVQRGVSGAAACGAGDFGNPGRARHALEGFKQLVATAGVAGLVVHHAKERAGSAHRVAENPQLAATATLNLVLNWRACEGGRVVSLAMTGRGAHANRTLELFSPGVGRYEGFSPQPLTQDEPLGEGE